MICNLLLRSTSILEKTKKLSHSNTTWAVYKAQSKSPTIWLQELLDLRYRVSLYMRMQKQRGARGLSVIQKICLYELKCLLFSHSIWLFVTPWTAACQTSLSITNSRSLLKLMSITLVMPSSISSSVVPFSSCLQSFPASVSFPVSQLCHSNPLTLCCPIILLPSIFPSISVFFSGLALGIRRPKNWSFSFSISPSHEGLGWSPCSPRDTQEVFPSTTIWKHQFFSASLGSNFPIRTWLLEKP